MNINDVFQLNEVHITEADKSEVDGVNILAKIKGTGFIVDGASGNNRFYSRQLWETAIKNTQKQIQDRTLFGYFGHASSNNDENLENVALIVTGLEIPASGKDGIIEYIIPSTESGKALNALLRAGSKLSVSTRAAGTLTHTNQAGNEVLDPKTYRLIGIDIVQNPGVANATPTLIESQGEKMTVSVADYTKIVEEKAAVEAKLAVAIESLPSKDDESKAIKEAIAAHEELYKDDKQALKDYQEAATLPELESLLSLVESYQEHGSPEAVKEALDFQHEMKEIGTADQIDKALSIAEEYAAIGTLEELKEKLAPSKDDSVIEAFVESHKVSKEVAKKVLEHCDYDKDDAASVVGLFAATEEKKDEKKDKQEEKSESRKSSYAAILGY